MFDPARVPSAVRDKLAVIGFWVCPPDLRDKVTGWDDLHEADAAVADNDLGLLGSAASRETAGLRPAEAVPAPASPLHVHPRAKIRPMIGLPGGEPRRAAR